MSLTLLLCFGGNVVCHYYIVPYVGRWWGKRSIIVHQCWSGAEFWADLWLNIGPTYHPWSTFAGTPRHCRDPNRIWVVLVPVQPSVLFVHACDVYTLRIRTTSLPREGKKAWSRFRHWSWLFTLWICKTAFQARLSDIYLHKLYSEPSP